MDKKKNKILIGCLALLLVMTVGYALFSENITINGTATAKGDFDISFTCDTLTSTNITADEEGLETKGGTGTCIIEGQTITTTSNLTKPTDIVSYKVTLTNTGSIPAVLKTVDSSNNDSASFSSTTKDEIYYDKTNELAGLYELSKRNSDGTLSSDYQCGVNNCGDSAAEASNLILQPEESAVIYIFHFWNDSGKETQPVLPETGVKMNYNITLGFEQVQAQ